MGTNYYFREKPCKIKSLHIGKSSAGWCFALHVIPELGINNLEDWKRLWKTSGSKILNEYEQEISIDEMIDIITERKWHTNLCRNPVDTDCVGHGEGTWDYIKGDFS